MNSDKVYEISLGAVWIVTPILIALKLIGCITWSWKWVLSPIWLSLLFIYLLVGVAMIVDALLDNKSL